MSCPPPVAFNSTNAASMTMELKVHKSHSVDSCILVQYPPFLLSRNSKLVTSLKARNNVRSWGRVFYVSSITATRSWQRD
jgi:hypothetical protein